MSVVQAQKGPPVSAVVFAARTVLILILALGVRTVLSGTSADGESQTRMAQLKAIISALHDGDLDEREEAAAALEELADAGLSEAECLLALEEAARPFPPRRNERDDGAASLIRAAGSNPKPSYIDVIRKHYADYSDAAKPDALGLLSCIKDRRATQAFMEIVKRYARDGGVPDLITSGLEEMPHDADVLFPELLDYADIKALEWDIYSLCLHYAQAGLITGKSVEVCAEHVLTGYRAYAPDLLAAQKAEGGDWMWEDAYLEMRGPAELLLDIMGYMKTPEIEKALREALSLRDPRLKYFAISSLLRHGQAVDGADVADVARWPEMRNHLYDRLQAVGKSSLFPEQFRTQKAFAESEMVEWLTYPTELGRAPDKIELMRVFPVDTETEDGVIEYYVFRFRTQPPHWAADEGWMAGIVGPYLQKDKPSTTTYGFTFSNFEPWEGKSAEQHLLDILDTLGQWKEQHGTE
jgi:hypothetical protein